MSKENKVVEIEEAVETGAEAANQVETEDFLTKVKRGASKAKKPLIIAGTFVLGLVTGVVATKNAVSSYDYIDDFEDEDFDVDVEATEE